MVIFLIYLVVAPLLLVLVSSVRPGGFPLDPGLTFQNYLETYADAGITRMLWNTLVFAVTSTAIAVVVGTSLAFAVERTDLPGRRIVRSLVILPMAIPPFLLALGWTMLLSPRIGAINIMLMSLFSLKKAPFDIFGLGGMIFVEGLALAPSMYLFVAPAMRNMDPSLEEASLASGASQWTTLTRVVLPLVWPSILSAAIFLFIVSLVVFDIPGTLGLPAKTYVLSTQIYRWISDSPSGIPLYGNVSALSAQLLLVLVALGWFYRRQTRNAQRYRTVTGKAFRPRLIGLGKWRVMAGVLVTLYFAVAVILPLAMLVWTSLTPYQMAPSWSALGQLSAKNHLALANDSRMVGAAVNTAIISVIAAVVVTLIAGIAGWLIVRGKVLAGLIDTLSFMPVAVPGVMMGVSIIYLYLALGSVFPIYGTIWIITIAYVTQYLSFGSRMASAVMLQIHPELEEAGHASGAGAVRVFLKITLPLLAPALIGIWIWVLSHAVRELSMALMLQGPSNKTVTTLLWDAWSSGESPRAAAVGVWLVMAVVAFMLLSMLFTRSARGTSSPQNAY